MNQVAALSGGGLVASASLLWPQAPLPRPEVIAVAWMALGLATVAAVTSNFMSALATGEDAHYQRALRIARAAGADREPDVAKASGKQKRRVDRLAGLAAFCGYSAPILFALGVVLLATWAVLAILS